MESMAMIKATIVSKVLGKTMTTYKVVLYKTTGETQTQWSSESHEEIMKLWEEEKTEQDKFSKIEHEISKPLLTSTLMIYCQRIN